MFRGVPVFRSVPECPGVPGLVHAILIRVLDFYNFFRWIRHQQRRITGSLELLMGTMVTMMTMGMKLHAPPTAEDEGEVSVPIRLPGVSLSGRRTTRCILR